MRAFFKKVPRNEVGSGTEIAILKKYFIDDLIDDPKDLEGADDNEGSRSYPIKVNFQDSIYQYNIKAYKTSDYSKDRRLILNSYNDPLGIKRDTDDFLCFVFTDKITRDSEVNIYVIKPSDPYYKEVNDLYSNRNGLLINEGEEIDLLNLIRGAKMESTTNNHPLNQILYGPPGTGKTYSTITKALDIIGLDYHDYEEAQELFQNELGKRIEFVTMHQSFSYEDFVQGLKPIKEDDKDGITFDYKNGVFKEICERADENKLLDKSNPKEDKVLIDKLFPSFYLSIDENAVYQILQEKVYNGKNVPQYLAIEYFNKKLGKKYCKAWRDKFDYILGEKSPRVGYQPDKFRDGELEEFTEYSNQFEKLTPEERKYKLVREWIEDKPKTNEVSSESNNHVIILDEINRANISRVFGELIALIEKDKRDGKLTATLPSGEQFTVPSNLYIIGTMNTADKSIALVDIALRRRFEFMPLYPNSKTLEAFLKEKELDQKEINNRVNLLNNLNRIIRAKKSVDFEIGHSYFMSDDNLIDILNKQILPLLNEYFMYDLRKVKEVIEKQQRDLQGNNIPKLGIELDQDVWKERGLIEVRNIRDLDYVIEETLASAAESNIEYN